MTFKISRGGAENATTGEDSVCDYIGLWHLTDADIDINSLVGHIDGAIDEFESDLQCGIAPLQVRDRRGHVVAPQTEAGADAQHSARFCLDASDRLHHLFGFFENLLSQLIRRLAVCGNHYAPGRPIKQFDLKQLLQDADALADVGGRSSELGGSGDKTGPARHSAEQLEVLDQR